MLTIEFSPPHDRERCSCCGGLITRLTRFVYQDSDAYAVYYASFTIGHAERRVSVIISIGEWGEDAPPSEREAFYLRIRAGADNFEINVANALDSPWHDVKLLGKMLSREEALAHPRIAEVFHISDHIVTEDRPVVDYLNGADGPATPSN